MSQAAETKIRVTAKDEATPVLKKMQKELASIKGSLDSVGNASRTFGSAGIAAVLISMASASMQAYLQVEKLERAYTSITGSGAGAASMLADIRKETERLGLSYVDSAEQAKGFFASIRGTTLQGAQGLNIFTGVSETGSALGLSSQDMDRAFRALGQISGKGKVMAEELRGQLGEVIPGAFQIAARAMGMTTAELDKFMSEGKLMADEFLPRFGEQLRKESGESAEKAAHSAQAAINRMSSAWTEAKANFMDSENAVRGINAVTEALNGWNTAQKAYRDERNIEKDMEKAGWTKQSYTTVSYDFSGNRDERVTTAYSAEQKEIFREQQKKLLEEKQRTEHAAVVLEKTLGDNRQRIDAAYKKTSAGQREAMQKEHKETLAAFDSQIAEYRKQGTDAKTLMDQRAAIVTDYNKKLTELDKKDNSGGKSTESALIALQGLNAEMAKLEGKGETFAQSMEKKRLEIAKLGKESNLSASAIASLQSEFMGKAEAKRERDLNKEIARAEAKIASMGGDDKLARNIALTQEIEDLRRGFQGLTDDAQKYEGILARTREAGEKEIVLKDAQLAANFMKELSGLSGNYGDSVAAINEQLRIEADIYRSQLPESMQGYVDQWERLKRLETSRDPMAGLERGMRKWSASATDTASQVESALTSAFDGASDALANMVITGKADFASLANSIIADMARIAAKQAIGGIVGGIGNIIGNALGGWLGGGSSVSTDIGGGGWTGSAGSIGNWDSGMGLSAGVQHTGGLVGGGGPSRMADAALFAGAQRLHRGGYAGLGPDEVPIIGLRGERMLNRAESRAYEAGISAARMPVPRPMPAVQQPVAAAPTIIIHNYAKGSEARAETQQQPDGSFKIDVIVEEVDRRMAQRVTSGTSHTARAMDSTRGMSPAPAAYRG